MGSGWLYGDGVNGAGRHTGTAACAVRQVDQRGGPATRYEPEANGLPVALILADPALNGVQGQAAIGHVGAVGPLGILDKGTGFAGFDATVTKGTMSFFKIDGRVSPTTGLDDLCRTGTGTIATSCAEIVKIGRV